MASESLFTNCKNCGKPVHKSTNKCPSCGKSVNRIGIYRWAGIAFIGLILIGMLNTPEKTTASKYSEPSPVDMKKKIAQGLNLEYSWKKEAFGTVMTADLVILNNSESSVKDIEVQCDHYAKSGTKIDSNNREIYEIFQAKTTRTFANYNLGFIHDQADSTICYIKDFDLVR